VIQWDKIAADLNYPGEREMWRALYRKLSVTQLSQRFAVSVNTVRKELHKHGIEARKPGGPNNQKITLDDDMILACRQRGVITVAKERGLDPTTVYKAFKRKGIKLPKESPPPAEAPSELEPEDSAGPENHDENR
jgi:transposase